MEANAALSNERRYGEPAKAREKLRRRPFERPSLILVMGVAGSGKTTFSKELLRHVAAVYLDNNHIVDAFFPHTRNGRHYESLRPAFYKALWTITEENLKLGNSVLLDVPHVREVQRPEWRAFVRRLAARTGARLRVIRCLCSEQSLRRRIASRGEKRDGWKLRHWRRFLEEQPIHVAVRFPHLDIDTETNLAENVRAALRYIRSGVAR